MRDDQGVSLPARRDPRWRLVIAALAAACALVVVLGWQNRRLRESLEALTERATGPYVGMFVPVVSAETLAGPPLVLGAPAVAPQILYFFTATCPYCKASIPAVHELVRRAPGAELIGVGAGPADELAAYARDHGFGFPVVELADDRDRALYRSRDVPMVLVVDRDGRVRYRHVGELGPQHVEEILAAAAIPAR